MLTGRVDEIDVQIEKVHRLIETAGRDDPDVAAGAASAQKAGNVQRKIDQACAAVETLDGHIRDLVAQQRAA
ncbi:hypothetical protein [Kutzneria buriramensis]|uniref:Uncharacterized protein n=1 Tax=Kutzneria buriramensis TaxID=1045776 RepID=A0A3E0G447_9PSEU|nr:hypothetical protein [Kutzneria buriramensis]REH17436.1 hypothetical protein BCF44_1478 [Kutzneria buriramensis]